VDLVWEIVVVLFVGAICLLLVRGIYQRRAQNLRQRLIYGSRKRKAKPR
jgi:hypothetical protein